MPSSPDIKYVLITGTTKSEEVLEHEIVGEVTIGTTNHFERYNLIHSIWSQHLNALTILLKDLFLEVGQRKTKTDVLDFLINLDFPGVGVGT